MLKAQRDTAKWKLEKDDFPSSVPYVAIFQFYG